MTNSVLIQGINLKISYRQYLPSHKQYEKSEKYVKFVLVLMVQDPLGVNDRKKEQTNERTNVQMNEGRNERTDERTNDSTNE